MGLRLSHQQKRAIGLDVGSSTVKAVVLDQKSDRISIRSIAMSRMLKKEEQREPIEAEIAVGVRDCLRQLPGKETYAVTGLSGQDVVVRSFSFPNLVAEEVASAVHLEALQVCPFDISQSTLDYQLIGAEAAESRDPEQGASQPIPTQGILTVATQASIQKRQKFIQKAGARCALIDVEGLALLNARKTLADQPDQTQAILHVGHQYSIVAILPPTGLPFVRDIAFAGRLIFEMISQRTHHDSQNVSQMLHTPDAVQAPVQNAFDEAVQHLADEIRETLHYYSVQQAQYPVRQIALTGGFSLTKGFIERLNRGLGRFTAVPWNPLHDLEETNGSLPENIKAYGPGFAVAIGLALRSL